ncbi:MAG: STAS domain-containing protein [Planctomycetaceae bacterium]|nr:STAS domain-containing protein [Planctomycetaceae bacterium]
MVDHLKILTSRIEGNLYILTPVGDGHSFRYDALQRECNAVRRSIEQPYPGVLIIDFSQLRYFGSEFIGALITLARAKSDLGGQVCFCEATEDMQRVLNNMKLTNLWPYHDYLAEAIAAYSDTNE